MHPQKENEPFSPAHFPPPVDRSGSVPTGQEPEDGWDSEGRYFQE